MKKFEISFFAKNKDRCIVSLSMIIEGKNEVEAGLAFNRIHAGKGYQIDQIKEILA
ncbi:hypothetical protein [Xenorhabdus sp. KK7.4]|uniref:hypothetical protein n=1 Tax=Xenorhabdus sp. KK7.4 TaxID=1851572 RepID=UPI000C062D87|nr:hypothetical protein [Xenorhabdus sp. KK7.4]PHM51261.1 hypothetical protein Xekk_03834 [Xenorhabdus sp. KK7.4]